MSTPKSDAELRERVRILEEKLKRIEPFIKSDENTVTFGLPSGNAYIRFTPVKVVIYSSGDVGIKATANVTIKGSKILQN